jgi:parvulin-like peptidyl-prolyl isomerase
MKVPIAMRRPSAETAVLLALTTLLALHRPLAAEELNRVVLRVNDRIATLYDYEKRRADTLKDVMRRETNAEERKKYTSQLGDIVFSQIFQDLLLESRADQMGVEATEAQVEAEVARIKKDNGFENEQQFHDALAQSEMTEDALRQNLKGTLRIRTMMSQEVGSRIQVKEEDLRRYYRKNLEEFRVPEQRQIKEVVVLDQGGLATAEERQKLAADIRAQVTSGKALAEVVAPYAEKGWTSSVVDLGWVSPGDLDATLETAGWKLAPGTLSDPVSARGGLHLLQVEERRDSRIPPFAEVSRQIEAKEQNRVYREEMRKYMVELEQRSLIEAHPPEEAKNFRQQLGSATGEKAREGSLSTTASDAAVSASPAVTPEPVVTIPAVPETAPATPPAAPPPAP